ncbi:hypothetical protein AFUB_072020 [Aspergillus fumigatus A1163]|uniref:Uncharacterized protein n=1 Tax=Aspergillus fumigatus (strain CBS 144.89 / FGSC A1163 / CEA10) TaxID=451804 RepID=B0Y5B3_ASPFC|nr:hypothetical protein AFUB_072020 [Aspergillus fumigatus A1163]
MVFLFDRFSDPTSSTININGSAPLTKISHRLYHNRIALVQQEATLFPSSFCENIAAALDVGPEEQALVRDDALKAACCAANVWDFVSSPPEGLSLIVAREVASFLEDKDRGSPSRVRSSVSLVSSCSIKRLLPLVPSLSDMVQADVRRSEPRPEHHGLGPYCGLHSHFSIHFDLPIRQSRCIPILI